MPKSGAIDRVRNYDLKMTASRVAELIDKRRPEMVSKQTEATNDLVRIELGVKEVVANEPVGVMSYPLYYDFARETYRRQRSHLGGYGLVREVQILIDKWAARGCDERILHRIRFEVFGIQSEEEFQVVMANKRDPRKTAPASLPTKAQSEKSAEAATAKRPRKKPAKKQHGVADVSLQ